MKHRFIAPAALAAIVFSVGAAAQMPPQRPTMFEWSGALGGFNGEDNGSKITGQKSDYAGYGGFGWRATPNVVLEAEVPFHGQRYDAPNTLKPPFTTLDSRAYVDTAGLAVGVKFVAPIQQRFEIFGGGGVGWYHSRFKATGNVNGISAEYSEYDSSVAPHVKAGFDVLITRGISVGLEYRKLWLSADFGAPAGGKIDIGGDFYYLTVRGRF